MKKKNFRLLLAAVLTTVMLASAMPAMAQTESVSQNGKMIMPSVQIRRPHPEVDLCQ